MQSLLVKRLKLTDDYLRADAAGCDAQKLRDEVEQYPEQVVTPEQPDFREEEHQGSRSSPELEEAPDEVPELEEAQESRRSVRPRKA